MTQPEVDCRAAAAAAAAPAALAYVFHRAGVFQVLAGPACAASVSAVFLPWEAPARAESVAPEESEPEQAE